MKSTNVRIPVVGLTANAIISEGIEPVRAPISGSKSKIPAKIPNGTAYGTFSAKSPVDMRCV